VHLDHAKTQRVLINEILKQDASTVLSKSDQHACNEEFEAAIDKWRCDHEPSTESSDLFLSKSHEKILEQVNIVINLNIKFKFNKYM